MWDLSTFGGQLQDFDGIAGVGEIIRPGDIYINKESPLNTKDNVPNPSAIPDRYDAQLLVINWGKRF